MRSNRRIITLAAALLLSVGLHAQVAVADPARRGMDPERLSRLDDVIEECIAEGNIPGAVVSVVRNNSIVYLKAYGNKSLVPKVEPMTVETIFDLASLSKCVGTTLAAMQLIEGAYIRLTDPVKKYIPEFKPWVDPATGEKVDIIIRDLMTHSSGIDAYYDADKLVKRFGTNQPDSLMRVIATEAGRNFRPGTDFLYSCLNFITLQNIIQKVTGQKLCDYVQEHIFDPMGLRHTCYFPLADDCITPLAHQELLPLVAPTEMQANGKPLIGAVHDPLARLGGGGNSGNAGVFSDAMDLSRICMMIMGRGHLYEDKFNGYPVPAQRILSASAVRTMVAIPPENDPKVGRTLGWDKKSEHSSPRGDLFNPETTIMHTGYTGTTLLIDMQTRTAIVLLTNRVHPTDDGLVGPLRSKVANIVAGSIIQ